MTDEIRTTEELDKIRTPEHSQSHNIQWLGNSNYMAGVFLVVQNFELNTKIS